MAMLINARGLKVKLDTRLAEKQVADSIKKAGLSFAPGGQQQVKRKIEQAAKEKFVRVAQTSNATKDESTTPRRETIASASGLQFGSRAAVARMFAVRFFRQSVDKNIEIGAKIYGVDGDGDGKLDRFGFTTVMTDNSPGQFDIMSIPLPPNTEFAGWVHTHGAPVGVELPDGTFIAEPFGPGEDFIGNDRGLASDNFRDSRFATHFYIVTPTGKVIELNQAEKTLGQIYRVPR